VKVVDYGLVKDFTADTGASTQVVLGTPDYIAPEAFTDPSSLSPAVDLYAIGCVGYYLLTGKRLFTGKTAMDICIQHVTKAPTPPSQVAAIDPALEAIIMRCLAKNPAARPASAAELRRDLLAVDMKDWSDADARGWWQRYRETSQALASATETPTTTMTVDLAART
jgi:serine/threonine-protein kinase